jgi:DNA-binding transcriptional ArsR family regulator
MNEAERLDLAFAALADPTRRAILARLKRGEATVSELAEPFGLRQPTISKHLKVLEDAGFVRTSTRGSSRSASNGRRGSTTWVRTSTERPLNRKRSDGGKHANVG